MTERPLGRNRPQDDRHIQLYPLRGLLPQAPPITVEKVLPAPSTAMRRYMDQGQEGSCVGWAWSWALSFMHRPGRSMPRYDARWIYTQAQQLDGDPSTPPAEGTTVRAGGDVLRTEGAVRVWRGKDKPVDPSAGIAADRWATSVDDVRLGLSLGIPVVAGTNWYQGMDSPTQKGSEWWMPSDNLGAVRGGHAWCIYGASDRRQAFKMTNSWGLSGYPLTWVPYALMERLLNEQGEAALITDR